MTTVIYFGEWQTLLRICIVSVVPAPEMQANFLRALRQHKFN